MREEELSRGDTRVDPESETSEEYTEIPLTETELISENPSGFPPTSTEAQSPSATAPPQSVHVVDPISMSSPQTTHVSDESESPSDSLETLVQSNTDVLNVLTGKVVELTGNLEHVKRSVGSFKVKVTNSVSTLASQINTIGENQLMIVEKLNELISTHNSNVKALEESNLNMAQQLAQDLDSKLDSFKVSQNRHITEQLKTLNDNVTSTLSEIQDPDISTLPRVP